MSLVYSLNNIGVRADCWNQVRSLRFYERDSLSGDLSSLPPSPPLTFQKCESRGFDSYREIIRFINQFDLRSSGFEISRSTSLNV